MSPDTMALIREKSIQRQAECARISDYARSKGLDTTWLFVNRHYQWFGRWYYDGMAAGYLIKRTGVKRIPPSERKATPHDNG